MNIGCFLPGMRRAQTRSTPLLFSLCGVFGDYIRTIRLNCDGFDELPVIRFATHQAGDLYFKKSVACLCGYRNSSPHKGVR
jgi:hypothetical protein